MWRPFQAARGLRDLPQLFEPGMSASRRRCERRCFASRSRSTCRGCQDLPQPDVGSASPLRPEAPACGDRFDCREVRKTSSNYEGAGRRHRIGAGGEVAVNLAVLPPGHDTRTSSKHDQSWASASVGAACEVAAHRPVPAVPQTIRASIRQAAMYGQGRSLWEIVSDEQSAVIFLTRTRLRAANCSQRTVMRAALCAE
jgi:hypothetical protein